MQLTNNNGETAADVGANVVARESIQRLIDGEEIQGTVAPRKTKSTILRSSSIMAAATGGVGGTKGGGSCTPGTTTWAKTGLQRPASAAAAALARQGKSSTTGAIVSSTVEFPAGVAARVVARGAPEATGGGAAAVEAGGGVVRAGTGQGGDGAMGECGDTGAKKQTPTLAAVSLPKVKSWISLSRKRSRGLHIGICGNIWDWNEVTVA